MWLEYIVIKQNPFASNLTVSKNSYLKMNALITVGGFKTTKTKNSTMHLFNTVHQ